ncbi:acyl-CoA dehydrogenase fadE12 [Variibacter gotjawalensis]|uniref:Acyl-CoA dehydrogenase fadE12 n=1 Tax=Variibacter gotjawalensis TaxID=1333996 RepID=A0A0S3PWS5_9BRAD|nr:acyl-CoA dehydrogenase family protein [Variibacter gotjawalensis]NIK46196.1 pimeloyl-CoA dehydrogenase small subunit [Variibacter gotjawalensis]RZS48113.1 pimeloyl-CoA dehydrogenase small subunit [Variibacter gotjawalensis]BAT60370.1 acyl-CoA dehydrogenase fadE12 [Variibacter gotjawalensis]
MDFDLNEEQSMLKDSVDKLLSNRYDFDARKKHAKHAEGFSPEIWTQLAELGVLAIPFAEEHGGLGGGAVETMIVMESIGRSLVLEPYFATVILGGGIVNTAGSDAQKGEILPAVADGSLRLAFAHAERQSRYNIFDVKTTAKKSGDGWVIDGEKALVLHGDSAQKLIVSARTAGGQRDEDGLSLFIVDAGAKGVSRRGFPTQDMQRGAEITLAGVQVGADALIGEAGKAGPVIAQVIDAAIAALCSEAVGAMEAMHKETIEYLKTRKQFGVAIGQFQVLQHRGAEMFVALEQARSMAYYATMMASEKDAAERHKAIAAAKVQIGRSGKFIGQNAVQLHGGVGMTMELKVGHYFKRMTMIDLAFGDADHHLAYVAAQPGGLLPASL